VGDQPGRRSVLDARLPPRHDDVVDPGHTTYERVSDPSVAYDAAHKVWLISSIPLLPSTAVPNVFISRSIDGGLTWQNPVNMVYGLAGDFDKNWTVCDNTASSPFFGHCYTEFDNFAARDTELMSTSTDGGLSWSVPLPTADQALGLGGQPLVQPNGTVIVPFESIYGRISAFTSTDGGASWGKSVTIAKIHFHRVAGNLRTSPLPSAEIDGAGTVYVTWEDCRFETGCKANDIVLSTSSDGSNWSAPSRVPANPVGGGVDHFIPGLAVDRSTAGATAHLALAYYYYPNAVCTVSTCQLDAGFVSSSDGGATWSGPVQLAGPLALTWLALTSQGYMVGDYISTSWEGGAAFPAIAVANMPSGGLFDETLDTVRHGLAVSHGGSAAGHGGDAGATSDTFTVSTAR
jgi:hypothetical protein